MSTPSLPIEATSQSRPSIARSPFSSSFLAGSPIAQASIERDLAEYSDEEAAAVDDEGDEASSSDEESETSTVRPDGGHSHSMASSYRRPSFVAFGQSRPTVTPHPDMSFLTKKEKKQARKEERSLLRDNHLTPPKHGMRPKQSVFAQLYQRIFSTKKRRVSHDAEREEPTFTAEPSETSALLPNGEPESARDRHERRNRQWEAAVAAGKIHTTWQREAKVLVKYASPLVVTFILQYSLTVASIFTVGHLGKIELGAVRYDICHLL
jgi:multidrug resistance protein, MATE family